MAIRPCLPALFLLLLVTACSDGGDQRPAPVSLTVVPTAAPEGPPGGLSTLNLRVTLVEPALQPVTVRYRTSAGTGHTHVAPPSSLRTAPAAMRLTSRMPLARAMAATDVW